MGWNHQLVYNYNNRNWSWSDEGHWPFSSVKVFSGRTFSLARYWNPTATWSHRFATSQQGNDVFAGWNLWTLWHVGGLKNKDSKWWSCNAHRAVKVPLRICFFLFLLCYIPGKKNMFFLGGNLPMDEAGEFLKNSQAHLRFNRVADDLTSGMPHLRKFARPADWQWLSNDSWQIASGDGSRCETPKMGKNQDWSKRDALPHKKTNVTTHQVYVTQKLL